MEAPETVVVVLLVIEVVADSTVVVTGVVVGEDGIGLSFGEIFFAWKLRMFRGRNNAFRGTIGACCKKGQNQSKNKLKI